MASRITNVGIALSFVVAAGCSTTVRGLSAKIDVAAVKAADAAYVDAWLANDPDRVMATLTADAVIIPSGMSAIEGAAAIREFWFPTNAPPTTVTAFTLAQHEVGGGSDLAFVRGTFVLGFEYEGEAHTNAGEYLSVLRGQPDGTWSVSHRMWTDRRDR